VTIDGFLEMRYVRMVPGGGDMLERWTEGGAFRPSPPGVAPIDQTQVVRGGCVMFEPGCLGGDFLGVVFIGDEGRGERKEGGRRRRKGGREGGKTTKTTEEKTNQIATHSSLPPLLLPSLPPFLVTL